ncbi:hypothetical protein O181_014145 [Austropuccinia psidii MF-1]|uniref:Carboxylic ester hydrolase n=1 Tax=Austropuccinia psidii MF-1 TaxID=1389203 RepID=A0A9Q3GPM6_9BASI|nr:hypothetical protein [Austropuccinia psidii MF-1]
MTLAKIRRLLQSLFIFITLSPLASFSGLTLQHHYSSPVETFPTHFPHRVVRQERETAHQKLLSIPTTSGTYHGFTSFTFNAHQSVDKWLGIRYAKPPLGRLRFRAPVLYDRSENDKKIQPAYKFGSACPQSGASQLSVPISEDCLTLNIYRPSNLTHYGIPVLVWIHGGGLQTGTSANFDGSVIVGASMEIRKPIIFVSINYRLNSFGFLNTDDLPLEDLQVGLKDQITSLKWLKLNIKAFGGNPKQITIWGQSAGAFSVSLLSVYLSNFPANERLFRAAIMDSGSPMSHTVPAVSVYDREGMPYDLLLNLTGCKVDYESGLALDKKSRLHCLRNLTFQALLDATEAVNETPPFPRQLSVWGPSYKEGSLIDQRPSVKLADGRFLRVPMLMGSNQDEGTLTAVGAAMVYNSSVESSDEYFFSFMSNTSILDVSEIDPEVFQRVAELYPDDPSLGSPFGSGNDTFGQQPIFKRLAAWYGDQHYQSPRRLWAERASQFQPVYVYYFDGPPKSTDPSYAGVPHTSELPLIFGGDFYADLPDQERSQIKRLASEIRHRYISFAHDLQPGTDWPQYTVSKKEVLRFNKEIKSELIVDDWREEQLEFLNSKQAIDTYLT